MNRRVSKAEYRDLAELRYRIRHFLQEGDAAARRSNLEPQQYLMLLAIRGLPEGQPATLRALAERMAVKHHSAVELTDRLEAHGLVQRIRSETDRREVNVVLRSKGTKLLEQVARQRIGELRSTGATLANAINALLKQGRKKGDGAALRRLGRKNIQGVRLSKPQISDMKSRSVTALLEKSEMIFH
jgi:DNA-binding MarR family transcriptional regulator